MYDIYYNITENFCYLGNVIFVNNIIKSNRKHNGEFFE